MDAVKRAGIAAVNALEADLLRRGDGVFSAAHNEGRYLVYKALQGATFWEVEHRTTLRRTFHNTLAEALAWVASQS